MSVCPTGPWESKREEKQVKAGFLKSQERAKLVNASVVNFSKDCIKKEFRRTPLVTIKCNCCGLLTNVPYEYLIRPDREFPCQSCAMASVFTESKDRTKQLLEKEAKDIKEFPEKKLNPKPPFRTNLVHDAQLTDIFRFWKVPPSCFCCGIKRWLAASMFVIGEIDHIDGDNSNNSLKNLRVLCPNCHRQTLTFRTSEQRKVALGPKIEVTTLKDAQTKNILKDQKEFKDFISGKLTYRKRQLVQQPAGTRFIAQERQNLELLITGKLGSENIVYYGDRLISEGLRLAACNKCGCTVWRGISQSLFMDVHHENENPNDNRMRNLNLYCRNCHRYLHLNQA